MPPGSRYRYWSIFDYADTNTTLVGKLLLVLWRLEQALRLLESGLMQERNWKLYIVYYLPKLGAGRTGARIPVGTRKFLFFKTSKRALGSTHWLLGAFLSQEVNSAVEWRDEAVRNEWSRISSPKPYLHGTGKDSFIVVTYMFVVECVYKGITRNSFHITLKYTLNFFDSSHHVLL